MADSIINAFHGGEAFWRYAYELDAAYKRGLGSWLPDPDFALSRDPEIWQKVRRDPIIDQAVAQRRHAVGGRPRHAVPPEGFETDKHATAAAIVSGALRQIVGLADSQMQLANCVFVGRTYAFVEGRRQLLELAPGTGLREWWVPKRLRDINRLRVRHVSHRAEDGRIETHPTIYDINTSQWVPVPATYRLVDCLYDNSEERLGYGRGILESIYYYHYAKGILLREGLNGAERFGQGTLVYEYQRDSFGDHNTPNTSVKDAALSVLSNLTARNQAAIPNGDKISRLDPSSEGHAIISDLLRYLDEGLTRRITGALLPGGGGADKGSLARSQVEQDTIEGVVEFDQGLLDDALTHSIVPSFFWMNRATLRDLGLDDRHRPLIQSKVDQVIEPETTSKVVSAVWTANPGVKFRRDEFYRALGFSEPKGDEETIDAIEGKAALAEAMPKPEPVGAGGNRP